MIKKWDSILHLSDGPLVFLLNNDVVASHTFQGIAIRIQIFIDVFKLDGYKKFKEMDSQILRDVTWIWGTKKLEMHTQSCDCNSNKCLPWNCPTPNYIFLVKISTLDSPLTVTHHTLLLSLLFRPKHIYLNLGLTCNSLKEMI